MNRGQKNHADECIVAIHGKGIGREGIRYIIAKLANPAEEPLVENQGEKNRASECLVMIGRYGFSKDVKEYIIAELTRTLERLLKKEERTDNEMKSNFL